MPRQKPGGKVVHASLDAETTRQFEEYSELVGAPDVTKAVSLAIQDAYTWARHALSYPPAMLHDRNLARASKAVELQPNEERMRTNEWDGERTVTCPDCDGAGRPWKENGTLDMARECPRCGRTGKVPAESLRAGGPSDGLVENPER